MYNKTVVSVSCTTYLEGKRKKVIRAVIEYLKEHPDFEGDIKVYSWAAGEGKVSATIMADAEEEV